MIIIKSKKGAIELSMTTIIIVVLGVMLLSLAIGWITKTMSDIGEISEQSFESARQAIHDQMSSDVDFFISGYSFKTQAGKYSEIYTGMKFADSEHPDQVKWFKLEITSGNQNINTNEWFLLPPPEAALPGVKKGIPIGVKVPKYVVSDSYSFSVTAYLCQDAAGQNCAYHGSKSIILEVE